MKKDDLTYTDALIDLEDSVTEEYSAYYLQFKNMQNKWVCILRCFPEREEKEAKYWLKEYRKNNPMNKYRVVKETVTKSKQIKVMKF